MGPSIKATHPTECGLIFCPRAVYYVPRHAFFNLLPFSLSLPPLAISYLCSFRTPIEYDLSFWSGILSLLVLFLLAHQEFGYRFLSCGSSSGPSLSLWFVFHPLGSPGEHSQAWIRSTVRSTLASSPIIVSLVVHCDILIYVNY